MVFLGPAVCDAVCASAPPTPATVAAPASTLFASGLGLGCGFGFAVGLAAGFAAAAGAAGVGVIPFSMRFAAISC